MPRSFIAVGVAPTDALRQVLRALGRMGRVIQPVPLENLHVTLRFLGDVTPAVCEELRSVISAAVVGVPPFEARVRGLGAYPDPRKPRVIWAALRQAQPLQQVVARLADPLGALGFVADTRPWQAHATLARVKARPPDELARLLSGHVDTDFGPAPVDRIDLMTSELTRQGAIHHVAASVKLSWR